MPEYSPFQQLGVALLLGLLVGLQRQRGEHPLAGLRTFPLITVLGTLVAMLDRAAQASGWVLAAGFLAVVSVVIIGNVHRLRQAASPPGITTEMAVLVMYTVGAYLHLGETTIAVAIGGGVAVLLQFKPELHGIAHRLSDDDLRGIMQFVLITFIILPVLPNQTFGPFAVFNPHEAWLMVVLIVGISLGGYICYKFFGQTAGAVLGGLLGGAISSTATTVSYARRAAEQPQAARVATMVILIASSIVYIRVLVEISVVAPRFLPLAATPIALMMLATLLVSLVAWLGARRTPHAMPEQSNPTELKSALAFGAMYALVLFALAAAKEYLGGRGLFLVAALSGLTDLDALTLSTARLVAGGDDAQRIAPEVGWRLIVVAVLSNMLFKTGIVAVLGNRQLLLRVLALLTVPTTVGLVLIFALP